MIGLGWELTNYNVVSGAPRAEYAVRAPQKTSSGPSDRAPPPEVPQG